MGNEGEEIIRVAVVDDQKLFAKGLSGLVKLLPDVEVVGVAYDGDEAIALCRKEEPDVVLSHLGERFGEPDGSATTLKVRLTHQDLANMIFSTRRPSPRR